MPVTARRCADSAAVAAMFSSWREIRVTVTSNVATCKKTPDFKTFDNETNSDLPFLQIQRPHHLLKIQGGNKNSGKTH